MNDKGKVKKYFEIPIAKSYNWQSEDYFFFIIDALYSTIMPFFLGYIVYMTKMWFLVFFLAIPIYIKLKLIKFERQTTKKLYFK